MFHHGCGGRVCHHGDFPFALAVSWQLGEKWVSLICKPGHCVISVYMWEYFMLNSIMRHSTWLFLIALFINCSMTMVAGFPTLSPLVNVLHQPTKGTTSETTMLQMLPDINATVQGMSTTQPHGKRSADFLSDGNAMKVKLIFGVFKHWRSERKSELTFYFKLWPCFWNYSFIEIWCQKTNAA